jgi:cation diffusion facilitator CzcD-associated flavoprotein CzcO
MGNERFDVVVIGGGQAGLATGYHLAERGLRFVILDARERIGDPWRRRWDSLRLFTPAQQDGLPGMAFPAESGYYPTKDEMAAYLEAYAERLNLPVWLSTAVNGLERDGSRYVVTAGERRMEADHVVVATGAYQTPRVPGFAAGLDPAIVQVHAGAYRSLPCGTGRRRSAPHRGRPSRRGRRPPRRARRRQRPAPPARSFGVGPAAAPRSAGWPVVPLVVGVPPGR